MFYIKNKQTNEVCKVVAIVDMLFLCVDENNDFHWVEPSYYSYLGDTYKTKVTN